MRLFALVSVVLLAACTPLEPRSGFGQPPPPTTPPVSANGPDATSSPPQTVGVTALPGLRFDPQAVAVRPGVVSIELQNQDVEDHTLVISELAVAMLAGGGETVRSTVRVARGNRGEYIFFCSIGDHREAGMEGIIRVG